MGLTIAAAEWMANLIVYLIQQFNIKSIDAAQIYSVVNGFTSLFPIAGAVIADSFIGNFSVIIISSVVSLLGMILFNLTGMIDYLRPPNCSNSSSSAVSVCESPTSIQFTVLYEAIALASIGLGGTRFTIATMGANQFDEPKSQGVFFNWYFFTLYFASVRASLVLCTFRTIFLNHAALKGEPNTCQAAKSWTLTTVPEVEDLKTLIKILPLWSSSFFLASPIAVVNSLVFGLLSTTIFIFALDRLVLPISQKLVSKTPTPLQRIGFGHVVNLIGMIVLALVESRRLSEAFHFPGQVALYYQEFPESLRSTSTAMIGLLMGIGYYLGTAIVDLFRRVTDWLPNDINNGRYQNFENTDEGGLQLYVMIKISVWPK
ncbi:hypothetical protein Scep_004467 [Stephania cephalantha]|uniref:Uncharacterized protein n=1 Tax=Stephania cephalantha TaxID=152367 RepID=A0AAP0KTY2_9MAGN